MLSTAANKKINSGFKITHDKNHNDNPKTQHDQAQYNLQTTVD
jgi:hypothetical protein